MILPHIEYQCLLARALARKVVIIYSHLRVSPGELINPFLGLETVTYRIKHGTLTCLARKSKPASGNGSASRALAFPFAVCTAFVHLVPGNQLVQFRTGFLVWNMACNPLLDPRQHPIRIILTDNW